MSATELVRWTTRGVLLLLALLTFADLLRERDRKRLDIHLVFAALAGSILVGIAQRWSGTASGWPTRLGWALLVAEPYLLLRVIGHFQSVPAAVQATAIAALLASYAILVATPLPPPLWAVGFGVVAFVLVEGYDGFSLVAAARSTRGLTRWRLALAASGTWFLLSAIALAGTLAFWRPAGVAAAPVAQALMLGVALSYYLAFAPPRWLHQSWQFTHLHRFLREAAGRSGSDRATTMLDLLGSTAVEAVGGITAAVALRNPEGEGLVFRASPRRELSGTLAAADGALARAWREAKPAYTESAGELGQEEGRLAASLGARALYALPLATPERVHGLLLVFNRHGPLFPADDLALLGLLADQTAVAVEEAEVLEQRHRAEQEIRQLSIDLARRAEELSATNLELEAFSYSVSHDLRAPLRQVDGFSRILLEAYGGRLDADAQRYLERIRSGATQMGRLIDDLLNLSRVTRKEIQMRATDLGELADGVVAELRAETGDRQVEWRIGSLPHVQCDAALMKQVWLNLLQNALKFTRPRSPAVIEIGEERREHERVVFVRDNGVGFDMKYHDKLFGAFQRLHRQEEFEGSGVGLATVQRIVHRHGGRIWSESEPGRGATFFFTCKPIEETTHVGVQ